VDAFGLPLRVVILPLAIIVAIFAAMAAFGTFRILTYSQPRQANHVGQMTFGEVFAPRPTVDKPFAVAVELGAFVVRSILAAIYLIPTMLAGLKTHRQYYGVLAINLFLGWTFIGWIGALVWALVTKPVNATMSTQQTI